MRDIEDILCGTETRGPREGLRARMLQAARGEMEGRCSIVERVWSSAAFKVAAGVVAAALAVQWAAGGPRVKEAAPVAPSEEALACAEEIAAVVGDGVALRDSIAARIGDGRFIPVEGSADMDQILEET